MIFRKKMILIPTSALLLLAGTLAAAAWFMEARSSDAMFPDLSRIPDKKVGLVLGCSPFLRSGRTNLFYQYRIEAAAQLYHAGKVSYLLVSGDNHTKGYDETSAMKESLIGKGVPETRVVCDYAGFSTLDSMVRAGKVFGLDGFTIITQRDHALRAVYIARHHGLDVVAYPAQDVGKQSGLRTKAREALARVKALLDLNLLNRQPEFLGDPIRIGPS